MLIVTVPIMRQPCVVEALTLPSIKTKSSKTMNNKYISKLVFTYLVNLVSRVHRESEAAADLIQWLADNAQALDFDLIDDVESTRRSNRRFRPRTGEAARHSAFRTRSGWAELRSRLAEKVKTFGRPRGDLLIQRLRSLAKVTGISKTDIQIIQLGLLYETNDVVEDLADSIGGRRRSLWRGSEWRKSGSTVSCMLSLSPRSIAQRLIPKAPLVQSGLVSLGEEGEVTFASRLYRLTNPADRKADVREIILGAPDQAQLAWSDFDHIAEHRDHICHILHSAMEAGERGVNVLVYGPPGAGKTEFCRTMGAQLEVSLFSIGEDGRKGGEPNRRDRLGDLSLAQCLLAHHGKAVLLFDEMVDLLGSPHPILSVLFSPRASQRRPSAGSKLFMNRLIENASVPTLWTANRRDEIPAVLLRRMTFILELDRPPVSVRTRIWANLLSRNRIDASPEDARNLARSFRAPPGVAAEVTKGARLADGSMAAVYLGLNGLNTALGSDRLQKRDETEFDIRLINGKSGQDLSEVTERLVSTPERRFSLCLQGHPGTGKSAFARYLATRMDLEVMHKRASDLLSMWVGNTEAQIAKAFRQARQSEAFLIFDEADSLLADRRGATRNWEVSQVNEMLTWMEHHPLPFACTTNYAEKLDGATLRRFTFKIELDFLTPEQAALAFQLFFGLDAPPELSRLDRLAPGDFAVVKTKAQILQTMDSPHALLCMLQEECTAKPSGSKSIGF